MFKQKILFLMLLFVFPLSAQAIPTINCHCFQDLSYNPAQPAAADPYFLASVQNSFFAAVFDAEKRSVVKMKRNGTSADDLWVAYWTGKQSGVSSETLLKQKQAKGEWKAVINDLNQTSASSNSQLFLALQEEAASEALAQAVVEDVFTHFQLLSQDKLQTIRKAGASNQELIIATLISRKTGNPPEKIYLDVKTGIKTWGEFVNLAQINMNDLQNEFSSILTAAEG
jgi:hypothetical protein